MRRFVEEIRVTTPEIAEKIITALETRIDDKHDPVYEVDMFVDNGFDPCTGKRASSGYSCIIKIFAREDVTKTDKPIGF